jgi:hypothetical protein
VGEAPDLGGSLNVIRLIQFLHAGFSGAPAQPTKRLIVADGPLARSKDWSALLLLLVSVAVSVAA